jgi:hypothetical protein
MANAATIEKYIRGCDRIIDVIFTMPPFRWGWMSEKLTDLQFLDCDADNCLIIMLRRAAGEIFDIG